MIRVKSDHKEVIRLFDKIRHNIDHITNGIKLLKVVEIKAKLALSLINTTTKEKIFKQVATLQEGDSFGELALLKKKGTRAATVVADGECSLGVIYADDYNMCLNNIEKSFKEKMVEFVREMP